MIKVFIAESITVCRELKKMINWEKDGFQIVGEAYDGEMALPYIKEAKPDLVIIDLQLPILNGLQISKLLFENMQYIKIILTSSCNDFNYVKEALNIGVSYYLQMPAQYSELMKALSRVKLHILKSSTDKPIPKLPSSITSYETILPKLFSDFVIKDIPLNDMLKISNDFKVDLIAKRYNVLIFSINRKGRLQTIYDREMDELLIEITTNLENNPNIIYHTLPYGTIGILFKGSSHENIEALINDFINHIKTILINNDYMEYFIAAGTEVDRFSDLYQCIQNVVNTFSYRFFVAKNQVFYDRNAKEYRMIKDTRIDLSKIHFNKSSITILDKYLRIGFKNDAANTLKAFITSFGKDKFESSLFCQYLTLDTFFLCNSVLEELGSSPQFLYDSCGDPQDILFSYKNNEEIFEYLVRLLQTVIEYREASSLKKYGSILVKAKEYIIENYTDPDLSLQNIANYVNISPSYFSTIFSQEEGTNFIEYLTGIRLEKAKELLLCSNRKSSEIGYTVGYKDPHYFSYIFKKKLGQTPKEFRTSRK
jgi:Response regulator containing CheY-like receiver domain and AraC-type DNA-binding domain